MNDWLDLVMADIVDNYLRRPDLPRTYSVHQDTTSLRFYGDYEGAEVPIPTFGFSSGAVPGSPTRSIDPIHRPDPSTRSIDPIHRSDLRQLIYGLTLHGATAVPLMGTMFDGNTSDVTANRHNLAEIAKRLLEPEQVTFVGDYKLVDAETVAQVIDLGMHFVWLTPTPLTYVAGWSRPPGMPIRMSMPGPSCSGALGAPRPTPTTCGAAGRERATASLRAPRFTTS